MSTILAALALVLLGRWFFQSPLAEATAEAIRRGGRRADPRLAETVRGVSEEVTALREQMSELAERVDFAERALADVRRRGALKA